MSWLLSILSMLFKGPLSRVLDTVDKRIEAQNDKERIKAEVIKKHMETRSSWLKSGGLLLMLLAGGGAVFHSTAVYVYSVFWCKTCMYPQDWSIAELPMVYADMQWIVILAWLGVTGIMSVVKRRL